MPRWGRLARRRSDELVLAVLLIVSVILSSISRVESGRLIHEILSRGNSYFLTVFGWTFELDNLSRDNARLRYRVAELSLRVSQLEEAERQNARLRELLEFELAQQAEILTGAEVIARGDGRQAFAVTISAGRADGVEHNMAVVTADGLVGRIDIVSGRKASIVSLLNDPANAVAAVVERSRAHGVFQYVNEEGRLLYLLQTADVMTGDIIRSSGLGSVYPEGLIIGTVISVANDPDGVTKRVVVAPAADLDRLEEVFVLRSGSIR